MYYIFFDIYRRTRPREKASFWSSVSVKPLNLLNVGPTVPFEERNLAFEQSGDSTCNALNKENNCK